MTGRLRQQGLETLRVSRFEPKVCFFLILPFFLLIATYRLIWTITTTTTAVEFKNDDSDSGSRGPRRDEFLAPGTFLFIYKFFLFFKITVTYIGCKCPPAPPLSPTTMTGWQWQWQWQGLETWPLGMFFLVLPFSSLTQLSIYLWTATTTTRAHQQRQNWQRQGLENVMCAPGTVFFLKIIFYIL